MSELFGFVWLETAPIKEIEGLRYLVYKSDNFYLTYYYALT